MITEIRQNLADAISVIRRFCNQHDACKNCELYDGNKCLFNVCRPFKWIVRKEETVKYVIEYYDESEEEDNG